MIADELRWGVETVQGEAGGEDPVGQLGVAFVICTRARLHDQNIREVVLAPLQFSYWNGNSAARARDQQFYTAWRAFTAAYFNLVDDPTKGATHYFNPKLASPSWYDPTRVTATLGQHVFLKLP